MTRRTAFAIITVLALVVFARPLLRNEVFSFRDHGDYFQPLRWFTTMELRHGRLPLWNVYSASGEPWLANPQTGVFYPPAWLFLILPFTTAYTLYLFLHVVLLGCGSYLLFARLTRPGGAALAAAAALTFSGPAMSLLDVSNNLTTFAWIPLIVWCAISGASARASAAAIAMSFLAGEPFFAAVGALLFVIARRRGVRDLIDVTLTSFALSSIQLLPFLSMVAASDRAHGGLTRAQLLQDSMPLGDWLRVAIPANLGTSAFDPRLGQHFIPIVYLGGLTILFALIGAVVARRRGLAWIALIAICVLIGAGSHLAAIAELLMRLPVTLFRYPARVLPLAALGICALAAIGCDRVIRGPRWQIVMALLIFVDVVVQIQPLLVTAPFDVHRVPYPPAIGRDAKIVRVDMTRDFDRDGWISGYLNLYDRRFDAWTAAPIVSQRYATLYQSALSRRDLPTLDALSVGYVVAPGTLAAFQPLVRFRGAFIHRNPGAFPLAYVRDDAMHRMSQVSSLAFTPSSVFIDVVAPSDGDVVVTQQAAPGWSVTVDGTAANPHESSVFRAVHVTRGHHAVKWIYRPLSLVIGAVLTFAALMRLLLSPMFVKRAGRENFLCVSLKIA
ncbi:MAG TPA: hypothetical protein VLC46_09410 [Thermoanaerobaculia bacterium]|jgi:hypothetical protein|nr:hypothetical protein [Thermoanaerobaculia bacterium]